MLCYLKKLGSPNKQQTNNFVTSQLLGVETWGVYLTTGCIFIMKMGNGMLWTAGGRRRDMRDGRQEMGDKGQGQDKGDEEREIEDGR